MNETIVSRAAAPLPAEGGTASIGAVSWGAIFAGAVGAAALSLILLVLGVGLGLSSVSPWTGEGAEATTVGVSTVLWLTITALLASGMGGFIAGRLRHRWHGTHTDEVYFRDTAHGFLAWAVATLITAGILSSAISSVLGTGVRAGGAVAGAAGSAAMAAGGGAAAAAGKSVDSGSGYFVDALFRGNASAASGAPTDAVNNPGRTTSETATIFAQSLKNGSVSPDDSKYVGQLVAQRTGLSQDDAEKRVSDVFARAQAAANDALRKAKEAADKARKESAYASLWLFISLLIGAFSASFAATLGGRRRDLV